MCLIKNLRKLSLLLFFLSLHPVLFDLTAGADSLNKEPISIGALVSLTGEFAMQGAAFQEGMQLAEEEINAAGGVTGHPLRVIVEDTRSDPKLANGAAKKLISIDKVIAGITTTYPETEVGGAQFERASIPSLALWDSSPQIDAMGKYIFSIGPWTPSDATVSAQFCAQKLKAKRVIVVNTIEPWSELVSDLFEAELKRFGGSIVARIRVNPDEVDFRSVITKISTSAPDVLFAPLASNIVPFYAQLLSSRFKSPVIGVGTITEEHSSKNPAAFEGVYQSQIRDPDNERTRALARQYESRYGKHLKMPWFVATGYDAIKLYAFAINSVGPNPQKIKDFLYTVRDFPGAAQTISISAGGSSPYYSSMFRIESGKFVLAN